ncbi:MAG: translocation/assembly module TamB domain-containing protein [Lunatimonas sp.]|uniref:translocation/assembly module TamB domain-containing protein n=1 Tax=Lunatimonas sp. TaxID=2060141 RepID=UPI00263AE764|nr:translocation/assembly module TamB domain-containing protein [Lunatimonas sp.]MCC5938039.1 translocation/assembly module TamB domain-containing protein [Lunatimonas sp.]
MEKKSKVTEILRKALKLLSRVTLFFLVLFLLAVGLLQIPFIQTTVAGYFTSLISERTGYRTHIDAVNIRWWDAISLKNVTVYDLQDSLMADLEEVYIDFSIRGLLDAENPGLDEVSLKQGNVHLITHLGDDQLNINVFLERLGQIFKTSTSKTDKKAIKFVIDAISLEKTSLDIFDYNVQLLANTFDYSRLRFRNLVAIADNFWVHSDTVAFDLKYLQGTEATSGIPVQQLRTEFTYSSTGMELANLYLRSNQTQIKDYLRFSYDSPRSLRNFTEEVRISANLDEAVLHLPDLEYFSATFPDVDDLVYLSGEVHGTVQELLSEQLLLRFGERSALFGKFSIRGLPEISETYFNLSLVNSTLISADLKPYVSPAAQKELDKFRDIRFDSDFSGLLSEFTASGDFRTRIGTFRGRVNFRYTDDNTPYYQGNLEAVNLDIGILLEDRQLFQKASFRGNFKGSGLTAESALIELDANFRNLGINNYNYSGITTNATFGKELFTGQLKIKDPNLVMDVDGTLDLRNQKDSANLILKLDTAFLQELNITKNNLFLSGSFELDTKGIELDNIEGVTRFRDVLISYEGRDLFLDYFLFQSLFTDESRVISLNSDLLVAGISGKFQVAELVTDVQELWEDYLNIVTNEPTKKRLPGASDDYYIDIYMDLRDPNPIINLLEPSLYISHQTSLEGAFYQTAENTVFNFFAAIDTIYFNGNYFFDNNIDFNTAKRKNSSDVLAAFYLYSKRQQLGSSLTFHNLATEAIWSESTIDLRVGLDQLATDSYLRINSEIKLEPGNTMITLEPSDIKLLDNYWEFVTDNSIYLRNDEVAFNNVKLFHEDQYISANGKINANPSESLDIKINDLSLDFLNSFGLMRYEGVANGALILTEYQRKDGSEGYLNIRDIHLNDFLIGDIDASAFFEDESIYVQIDNFRENKKSIEVRGTVGDFDNELNLVAIFEETNLAIAEPFLQGLLSDLSGTASGRLKVEGTLGKPEVTGQGTLSAGRFLFNYLNTQYLADGEVLFDPNEISFRAVTLRDINNNRATLSGGLTHDNFSNFIVDVNASLTNMQVLNTTLANNELFYGTAFATGTVAVFGAFNNLEITANATSQPNTRIFIPLSSSDAQVQEDFITFINVYDTTAHAGTGSRGQNSAISNLNLNLNLDLNPNAYLEIQIDPRTGENIQGRGRGVLNLNVDTQGNFNMTGTYEIVDALYNFSLYNIINKRFVIEPGGRITWFGDPYQGNMNIRASYEENVSMIGLQNNPNASEFETAELKRRYPVKVIMNLEGQLLSPDIGFAFDFSAFPEGSELQTTISAFQNRLANDEQEKNRQVFSLIMLRRFSPPGQFSGAGIGFSNLSQLVSSQLNSLIAQVDQNLEIDFDLTALDETALETFQLRVAYTFLDGRLRVTRDGGFTDLQGNADFNTIAGDWQAEYLLTEDGRYRVRVYNRNNFNTLTALAINNRAPNTYGVSVSQNLLFSSFRELFQNLSRRSRTPQQFIDDDNSLRYNFEIKLDELAPDLFKPDPELERPAIQILDRPADFR